jgi:hypothetical protein
LFVVLGAVLHKKQFGRSFVFKNWAGYWGLEGRKISNESCEWVVMEFFDGCLGVSESSSQQATQHQTFPKCDNFTKKDDAFHTLSTVVTDPPVRTTNINPRRPTSVVAPCDVRQISTGWIRYQFIT